MAGNIGDVIQLTQTTDWSGIRMLNVYYYMIDDAPTETYLTGLLTEFQEEVLAPYSACQPTNIVNFSLYAKNIFTGDEATDSSPTPATGTRTPSGDSAASFIAANIKLVRQNARVRHGRKMLYIPLEGDLSGNQLSAGFITLANAYASACAENLDAGGIDLFVPVIVGRVPYTTSGGDQAYRLPTSQAEMGDNWSPVVSGLLVNRVSTMNSRKFWRGM